MLYIGAKHRNLVFNANYGLKLHQRCKILVIDRNKTLCSPSGAQYLYFDTIQSACGRQVLRPAGAKKGG
jgi:hypothetical protein